MGEATDVKVSWRVGEVEVGTCGNDFFCRFLSSIGPTEWKYIESGDGNMGHDALIAGARLARRVEELEGAIQNTPCHACNREKIPTLCIGENGCGGFACAGWSDMCCECGYEYAMGQIE